MDMNLEFSAGESGEEMDISLCGEKGDIILPVDDLSGASSAMARRTRLSGVQRPRLPQPNAVVAEMERLLYWGCWRGRLRRKPHPTTSTILGGGGREIRGGRPRWPVEGRI